MNKNYLRTLVIILLSMVGTKAWAYDIAVENADGVTIYYNYINDATELEVTNKTPNSGSYSGSVIIPEEVTFMNRTRKVTSIGGAFYYCLYLTSVTIPSSVTNIGVDAFKNYNMSEVISKIENPFTINSNTFSVNTFYNATLYVPVGTIDKYKATEGWKKFTYIEEGEGGSGNPSSQKCENPTISYQNGKLTFHSTTEGATCQYSITDSDIKSGSSNEVQLSVTYNISVFAAKSGYENSETVTATLCWIDSDPKTEGITDGVAEIPAKAVLIQNNSSTLTIQGADDGTQVSVYNINGTQAGSAVSCNGSAMVNTNLQPGSIAIVKIGEKSVKVVVK